MRLKFKRGTKVKYEGEPRRIGVVLGRCQHGFYLIGFRRPYSGHSGHDIDARGYVGRCCWARAGQLRAA